MKNTKLLKSILFVFLCTGCNNVPSPEEIECFNICSRLENSCNISNTDDFEFESCYEYCVNLPSVEEIDGFQVCSECYIAIKCNPGFYAAICYPHCESAAL